MKAKAFVVIPHSKNKGTEVEMEILPLVLCKNCKWRNERICENKTTLFGTYVRDAWFCADGETKEGEA